MQVGLKLNKQFEKKFNSLKNTYGESLSSLNGLSDSQLDLTVFIDKFLTSDTIADVSIDGSANVQRKDITALTTEMGKSYNKLLAYSKIYSKMLNKFGKENADEWLEKEWIGYLYMHDSNTCSYKHYCYAYDLKDLAEKGLFFLPGINALPPKHLVTFVDFIKEFISFTCNRSSGAVGLPNLIPYMYYFWREDCKNENIENPEKFAKQNIQRFIYAVNQPFLRDSQQSAFTNTSIFDTSYLYALFGSSTFPDGSDMIDDIDGIMQFQKWYMEEMSEIRKTCMFTFPVNTISMIAHKSDDGSEPVFDDKEFAEWAIRHNMTWNDSNIFCDDSPTSLSNCCRLKSNIEDLGYFNSIGGTSLRVGSVKVSTVNLVRPAYECDNEDDYIDSLYDIVYLDCMALDCVRDIIKSNVKKGLLPNFSYGLVNFDTLYNTVGFTGVYEVMKKFGHTYTDEFNNVYYDNSANELGQRIFNTIREASNDFRKNHNCTYMINTEQIPGETAASVLMKKDKIFYPETVIDDLPLYGNQFLPLGVKATLNERIRVASLFDSYCNGGSILHINTDAPFDTFEKAWKMFCYVVNQGVTYFAFTGKINVCKHNHSFFTDTCPICGGKITGTYARIVGFFQKVEGFSKERKSEFYLRQWHGLN